MLSMPFLQLTGKLAAWHYCSIGVDWRYQMTIFRPVTDFQLTVADQNCNDFW